MPLSGPRARARARRALERGFTAIGRKLPELIQAGPPPRNSVWTPSPEHRQWREQDQRETLQLLELGRELVARGADLERQADEAKRAGVEVLRHAWPAPQPWSAIAELLGMSAQGAHKRYRDVEGPEAELTIDDELDRAAAEASA